MNTTQRQEFRKRLEDLTDVELMQRMFLMGLVARIECEMEAYAALFEPAITLEPPPDTTQLTTMQYLLSAEMKKRRSAKAKLQKLPTTGEGETNHADHEQNNGSH